MSSYDTTKRTVTTPAPGAELVKINHGIGGSVIVARSTVERITPTGIIVMANGTRLVPSDVRDDAFIERGGRGWQTGSWYRADSDRVAAVEAERALTAKKNAVRGAYEAWLRSKDDPALVAALHAAVDTLDEAMQS